MFKEITKDNWLLLHNRIMTILPWKRNRSFMMMLKDLNILKDSFVNMRLQVTLKLRLVLNHIIVLNNVFGVESAVYTSIV
jgi:hypothetical protein